MTTPPEEARKPVAPAFAKWLQDYGLPEVAAKLGVSAEAVRKWDQYARGVKSGSVPRSQTVVALVKLSRGRLTAGDILCGVGKLDATPPIPASK